VTPGTVPGTARRRRASPESPLWSAPAAAPRSSAALSPPALACLLLLSAALAAADPTTPIPAVEPAVALGYWTKVGLAVLLLAVAGGLACLEFVVVSGGLIAIAAVACGIGSVILAFSAGPGPGWTIAVALPVVAVLSLRWGVRALTRSTLVVQAEITADAGIHHAASALGVAVGSTGVLLTPAMPTGRARFADAAGHLGEIDVVVSGAVLDRGADVRVIAIAGATITVIAAPTATPT